MKKKKILSINILICCVLLGILAGFVGLTLAFYTSTNEFDNKLRTVDSAVYLLELFDPDDLWLPGETKEKVVSFGNQSGMDQVIRFKVRIAWAEADGSPWQYTENYEDDPIVINWTEEITSDTDATWAKIGDYYYYKSILFHQDGKNPMELPAVISSVTFGDEQSNDVFHADDFSGKVCRLYVEMETLDVDPDATAKSWNVVFTRDGDSLTWRTV